MKKTRTVALLLMFLFLLNLISGCQQPTEKAIESSDKDTRTSAGYGTPPQAGGYGTPPPAGGYGTPPPAGGYGTPPPAGGYGTPPPAGGYGVPGNR